MINKTRISDSFRPIYPSPAALIVSADENRKANIMTAGEVFNISIKRPVIVGIAIRKETYTHSLISKTNEFTINLPTAAILKKVDLVGTVSGKSGIDKFAEFGLTPLSSSEISAPIIAECPVNLECKVWSFSEVGDHDLFLGEVVATHIDSDKIDQDQTLLTDKLDFFSYVGWSYYAMGENLGRFGFSRK